MANAKAHRHLLPAEAELSKFTGSNYKQRLMCALNWYNANVSDDKLRSWALDYAKQFHPVHHEALKDSLIPSYDFHHVGILSHLVMIGFKLDKGDKAKIAQYLGELVDVAPKYAAPKAITKVSLQDRLTAAASARCAELDGMIDGFISDGAVINVKAFMITNSVSGPIVATVRSHVKGLLDDLRELSKPGVQKDPQLVEGYKNLTAKQRHTLIDELGVLFNAAVAVTKRKPKSPSQQVKHIPFLKSESALGLKSIDPTKLVGAKEVWTYNVQTRTITVMRGSLVVDGTVLRGLDKNTSLFKKVRNPRKYFHRLGRSAETLNARFLREKTLERTGVTGRLGKKVMILAAF